jgi:hypothetical protein
VVEEEEEEDEEDDEEVEPAAAGATSLFFGSYLARRALRYVFSSASLRSFFLMSCNSRCSLGRLSVIDLNSLCASSCFLRVIRTAINQ